MRMIGMLCFEFKKLKRKKFFWILLLVIIMSAVIQELMGKRVYNNVAYGETLGFFLHNGLIVNSYYLFIPIFSLIGMELFLLERQNNTLINILTVPITKNILITIKTVVLCIIALLYTVLTFLSICLLETEFNLHNIRIDFVLTHLAVYVIHGIVCTVIAMMIIGIMLHFKQSAQAAVAVSFIASFVGVFISQTPLPYLYCVNAMFYLSGAAQSTGFEKMIAAIVVLIVCGVAGLLFNRLSKEEC